MANEKEELNPEVMDEQRKLMMADEDDDPIARVEMVYQLWRHWADFQIYIISPTIPAITPPILIEPELIEGSNSEYEFVYPIHDHGFKLATSKALDMYSSGMAMCRLYYTIEKMIALLVERLKSGGISGETEVQIAFGGHELAQRKGFEAVINLTQFNVVVTNFDPGVWGEHYLEIVKRMADKGFGYPPEAPRGNYRQSHLGAALKKSG